MSKPRPAALWRVARPVVAYCICSMSMIYTNKAIMSVYAFPHPTLLLLVQAALAVALIRIMARRMPSVVHVAAFDGTIALQWSPVTILFGAMVRRAALPPH